MEAMIIVRNLIEVLVYDFVHFLDLAVQICLVKEQVTLTIHVCNTCHEAISFDFIWRQPIGDCCDSSINLVVVENDEPILRLLCPNLAWYVFKVFS